jgi:hypothetical protein
VSYIFHGHYFRQSKCSTIYVWISTVFFFIFQSAHKFPYTRSPATDATLTKSSCLPSFKPTHLHDVTLTSHAWAINRGNLCRSCERERKGKQYSISASVFVIAFIKRCFVGVARYIFNVSSRAITRYGILSYTRLHSTISRRNKIIIMSLQ